MSNKLLEKNELLFHLKFLNKKDFLNTFNIANIYSFLHFGRFILGHGTSFLNNIELFEYLDNEFDSNSIKLFLKEKNQSNWFFSKSDLESFKFALSEESLFRYSNLYLTKDYLMIVSNLSDSDLLKFRSSSDIRDSALIFFYSF